MYVPIKNFREKGAWAYPGSRDCSIFGGTPYYVRNGKRYGFQTWPVHSEGPSELLISEQSVFFSFYDDGNDHGQFYERFGIS